MDYANFALRGSSLKNTDFVYGLVAYTGHETKIMLNSVKAQPKKSTAEKAMSKQVIYIFIMQCLYCSFASIYYNIWLRQNEVSSITVLRDRKALII